MPSGPERSADGRKLPDFQKILFGESASPAGAAPSTTSLAELEFLRSLNSNQEFWDLLKARPELMEIARAAVIEKLKKDGMKGSAWESLGLPGKPEDYIGGKF